MNKSKLIYYYQLLSKEERNALGENNMQKDLELLKLFKFLNTYAKSDPEFKNLKKEAICKYVFIDVQKYRKWTYLLSKAVQELQLYLAMREVENQEHIKQQLLSLSRLNTKRKQDFSKAISEYEKYLHKSENLGNWKHFYQFDRTYRGFFHSDINKYTKQSEVLFQECHDELELFYRTQKERLLFESEFREQSLCLQKVVAKDFEQDEKFVTWNKLRALVKNYSSNVFQEVQTILFEKGSLFSDDEKISIVIALTGISAKQLKHSYTQETMTELLTFCKTSIEEKLIGTGSKIDAGFFLNVVSIALANSGPKEARNFFDLTHKFIHEGQRKEAELLAEAEIQFEEGEANKSWDKLAKIELKDVSTELRRKLLLSKCYFALGNDRLLIPHLENFRNYVYSKKVPDELKLPLRKFIKITGWLTSPNLNFDRLRRELEAPAPVGKAWLERVINHLEKYRKRR